MPLLLVATVAVAVDGPSAGYVGLRVADVIDAFRDADHPFVYSTSLVGEELVVETEPEPGTPQFLVTQILRPHGLMLRTEAGVYLVVRIPRNALPASDENPLNDESSSAVPAMEMVVVSASRYQISRDITTSNFGLDRVTIQNMPDIGEDPIRVAQRLPGTAASGASAKTHFRGGDEGEVGIMLNGQWLFDPFHVRDYQNIFSVVDARAIQGVEVYTGGFPVRYGDRMSGLILMDSQAFEEPRHTEIGLSVFNTSFLTAGSKERHSWVVSARRGNLDLVIDSKFGEPNYYDIFVEYAFEFSPDTRLSINALYADDKINLILETQPDERDQITSDTRNAQFWLRLNSRWSPSLASTTIFSAVDYSNRRRGDANDIEKMVATVADDRYISQFGFRQDWVWSPSEKSLTQWGIQATAGRADYSYVGDAEYFGLQALYQGQPKTISRSVTAQPKGGSYAVYVSNRWRLANKTVLEWGLRWDDQTYTDLSSDAQLSPRLNVLFRPWENTELRLSAGRYFQSQSIQSLQVEDGIDHFWRAQRADHLIAGIKHLTDNDTSLRLEIFYKDIAHVRPRFENLFNPLGSMPELQADRTRLDPSSARSRGLELSAVRSAGPLDWWASYTWSEVTDNIDGMDVPRSWDQRHSVQGGFGWQSEKWNFFAAASVHTGWPTTNLELVEEGTDINGEPILVAIPGPRNAQKHGIFASVDARLSRKFKMQRGSLLVFLEVTNVLNRSNECCLDWDFNEDPASSDLLERGVELWMPLLPAIGFLWEF